MSDNPDMAQSFAQGNVGNVWDLTGQNDVPDMDDNSPAPDHMTNFISNFIPIPRGVHSGLTVKQARIVIKALTQSVLDRSKAVLLRLKPDIDELNEDLSRIKTWKSMLNGQLPEKIRLALEGNAREGDMKSVSECLQRDSFMALERSNKILRVLSIEKNHATAHAKAMDEMENCVKGNMEEVQQILGHVLSALHLKLPPGAEYGLVPHKDVKIYEGTPLLFYPKAPEGDENDDVQGQWFVAEYDHPMVTVPGTAWNKWIRNWADPDSDAITIKLPPVARAFLAEIRGEYNKALVQFLRSEPVRSGVVQLKPTVFKEIQSYQFLKKICNFRGRISHHFVSEENDSHGDDRFSELPTYDPRGELQIEVMNNIASMIRGGARAVLGMNGSTMTIKVVEFSERMG